MGCLKNLLRAIILTLAIIGFLSIGGKEFVSDYLKQQFNPSAEEMAEITKKVGDFSQIPDEFEVEKAVGIMGYNAVVAEHKASGQKMFVVDSGKKQIISQEDLKSDDIEQKLVKTAQKFKYQSISASDIKITKRGTIDTYGQEAPYIKFEAKVSKLPIGEVTGILSVAQTANNETRTIVSVSEKGKYSQLISDEFFKNIK